MNLKKANSLLVEITKGMKYVPFISYAAVVENPNHEGYYFIEFGLFEESYRFLYGYNSKWIANDKENNNLYKYFINSNLSNFESDICDPYISDIEKILKKETKFFTFHSSGIELLNEKSNSNNNHGERIITGGISIGNKEMHDVGGTLGALLYLKDDHRLYALTNSHVVAKSNSNKGEEIHYPSLIHDTQKFQNQKIGILKNWVHNKEMDIALVEITNEKEYTIKSGDKINSTPFKGINDAIKNSYVSKVGYKTKESSGYVRSLNASVRINSSYNRERKPIIMRNQIMIENMEVDSGDSGSIVTNQNREAIGVLFARDKEAKRSFLTPIKNIFVKQKGNDIDKNPPFNLHKFY